MPASAWTPQYLRERCHNAEIEIMTDREADPEYEVFSGRHRHKMRMDEYFSHVLDPAGSNDRYLVANNFFFQTEVGRGLLGELRPLPEFLSPDDKGDATYLWLGPKGTVTPLHHDVINIFYFQLYGTEAIHPRCTRGDPVRLQPPGRVQRCGPGGPGQPSASRTTRGSRRRPSPSRQVRRCSYPVGWWHHVRSLDVSVSVSTTSFLLRERLPVLHPETPPAELAVRDRLGLNPSLAEPLSQCS